MSLWLLPSSALSVPRAYRCHLVHESSYSVGRGLGGGQDGLCWAELRHNNGWVVLLYQHVFLSVSLPPFFCCFYHLHPAPITSRKSRAVHLVRYHRSCVVTSGCCDSHWLCILCQTIPVLSTLFQAGRQVFRCRSGIELPGAHSVSIFWPCYMYSKWLFTVTSIFKTRFCLLGLKVLHNLVRKSFCWIMHHIKVPISRRIHFTNVFW